MALVTETIVDITRDLLFLVCLGIEINSTVSVGIRCFTPGVAAWQSRVFCDDVIKWYLTCTLFVVKRYYVEQKCRARAAARLWARSTPMVARVEAVLKKRVVPGKTLLFIDEIQNSKNVMELLRFFAEEYPQLHVIATGSLIDVVMSGKWNVPVGRVEYLQMYPLTFFEYLEADGRLIARQQLEQAEQGMVTIPLWREKFEEYLMVGGMPEAVTAYTMNRSYLELTEIHQRLSWSYEDDIAKYVKNQSEATVVRMVLTHAPTLAGRQFTYENMGNSGFISRDVGRAVEKVEEAKLLYQVKAINSIQLPLAIKDKRPKKMLWIDVGLMNTSNKARWPMTEGEYRGRVMEQIVGQTLLAHYDREKPRLYYWGRNKNEGSAEVDFACQWGQKLAAFEVKSGQSHAMKSLMSMIDEGGEVVVPIRVSWEGPRVEEYKYAGKKYRVLSVPFYLLERWEELADDFLNNSG